MSSLINILPDHVVNKIAAGEVVERPASVVKELIENSIDAGATEVLIDIEQAGKRLIRITDNGSGMSSEDARTSFLRHATSKITSDVDLEAIRTMGFRGEALSSIASVSQVRLQTTLQAASSGTLIEIEAGVVKTVSAAAPLPGTSLEISHLFYNTPARLKFLKSPATEFSHILTAVSRQAMAHPGIRFRLTHQKKAVLDLPPCASIRERVFQLYGSEVAENVAEFSGGRDQVHVHGLISRPGYTRADKTYQEFFVNKRSVKNASFAHAFYAAYGDMLMRDRHPLGFLFLEIDPALVDVNVHPAKAEVRFRNQSQIHDLVRDVIREGLRGQGLPAATSAVPGAHAEGVHEALSEYVRDLSEAGSFQEKERPSAFFGRRRSDAGPAPASADRESQPDHTEMDLTFPSASRDARSAFPTSPTALLVPLAQVQDSFIVAQSREGMALIDQHAAHERVLFEKLQDQLSTGHIFVQNMLMPISIDLGPAQAGILGEYLPELEKLGFSVEDFGNNTFIIKAVPALLVGADHKKLLLDILDEVNVHGKSGKMEKLRDEVLSVMACHPAIKVHRKLSQQEMEHLLDGLFRCRMPHTCPHGRPTIVRFSMDEIRKMFKRI